MRPLLLLTIVVISTLEPPPAHGDSASTGPDVPVLDEEQVLATLAATDPRLDRIAADVDLAAAEAIDVGLRPDPTFGVDREEVFPDGGVATNYLRLTIPFEISGQRARRVDAARTTTRAAGAEGDHARFSVIIEALRVYRLAAYERARVALLRSQRAALVAVVAVVRKRTTAGAASGYDLQRIELELASYDDLIAEAETRLASSRLELGALVGKPTGVDAAEALELPSVAAPPDSAVQQRGDYRAASLRIASAQALTQAANRGWIPDLTVSGGVMSQDVGVDTAIGYTAGIALTIPVFDRGQVDHARARAQRRAAEADRTLIVRAGSAAIRMRHQTLVRTVARARTIGENQVGRLEQLIRSAETGYREGGGNVIELLDAYTTARDTRLRDLELRRDARLAELDLWLALGRRP